ncbi:MAG: hypothetical protein KatS3mg032_1022 [Cyclobacteriaceae bacterium]|nr:MAG: hypothetical protein KatS3mg032_1022 [Cyclobacteriaceae bacterium]
MKTIFVLLLLLNWSGTPVSCLTDEELKLYRLINEYRRLKGLPAIALSAKLSRVAALHARDLAENNPVNDLCNLHSWSDKGNWTPCCYTNDHQAAACMWNKPRELTGYTGDGFEIAYFHSGGATANAALESWKKSEGHHNVIINRGIWQRISWKAMGVGINQRYAVVWFGFEADSEHCD